MKLLHHPPLNTQFEIQLTFPVNKPENNVRLTCRRRVYIFEVPANHPLVHRMGLDDLIDAVNHANLLALSTGLNKN